MWLWSASQASANVSVRLLTVAAISGHRFISLENISGSLKIDFFAFYIEKLTSYEQLATFNTYEICSIV